MQDVKPTSKGSCFERDPKRALEGVQEVVDDGFKRRSLAGAIADDLRVELAIHDRRDDSSFGAAV